MRLVSACYEDWYPFDLMWPKAGTLATDNSDDLKSGDILIVWGGSDIHPSLYKQPRTGTSGAGDRPSNRDLIEWALMKKAAKLGLPIIGVCRGAQMLCALAGGTLIQHVNGHSGNHLVKTFDDHLLMTNSLHHQMMNPTGTEHKVVAETTNLLSNTYNLIVDGVDTDLEEWPHEPEFIHFTGVNGFAVQWHPEMMNEECEATKYVEKYLKQHI